MASISPLKANNSLSLLQYTAYRVVLSEGTESNLKDLSSFDDLPHLRNI